MGADLGAHSARTCSRRLSPAHLGTVLTWLGRIPADRRVPETFLGVKGSPVQIRPSRLVRASFRTQQQACERLLGAHRAPTSSMKPLWCGVSKDITPLVSRACRAHLRCHPLPGALASGSKRRRSTSGCQGWLWATPAEDPGGIGHSKRWRLSNLRYSALVVS